MPETLEATPTAPYTVEDLQFGPHMRPTRKYPDGRFGDILSDDEIAMWRYLQHLEMNTGTAANNVLFAEVGAPPPPPADGRKKGKKA